MTISGQHTLHELADLLSNFDSFAATLAAAHDSGWQAWSATDPAAADDWQRDWDSFVARWTPASQTAHARIQTVSTGDVALAGLSAALTDPLGGLKVLYAEATGTQTDLDKVTDEALYQATLAAWNPSDGDPTGFDELQRRWGAQKAAPQPTYTVTQPTAPDADLGAYKAADKGVQAVQRVAQQAGALVKSALPPTWVMLLGGAAAVALLYMVAKGALAASPAGAVARAVRR